MWSCSGIPPVFWIVSRLPVFSSGHNTRLAVLYLLCLALLAGWGLDDSCGAASSRRVLARGGRAAGVPGALHGRCASRSSWDLVGDALAVTFGFDRAPGARRSDGRRHRARRGDAAVGGGRGRRARAAGVRAPALARGRRAGAGRRRPGVGGRRLQPGDRSLGRRSQPATPRDPRAAARRAGALRVGRRHRRERDPDGLQDPGGARLRPAGRGALRPAVAREALARVPVAGRPAAGVHPARAAEGRRGAAALPVVPRRQPDPAAARRTRRCASRACG